MKKEYYLIIGFIFLLLAGQEAGMALEGDVTTLETTDVKYETGQGSEDAFVDGCYTWRRIVCVETPQTIVS